MTDNDDYAELRNRSSVARMIWGARQIEIDALRERERRLREYVTHKPDCELVIYCAHCSSHRDSFHEHLFISMADADPEQSGCTCGLAELLAAKEDVND